jgi:ESCRT-II complex subunit VPS22
LAGLQKAKAAQNSYKTVGADINASQLESMQQQLAIFQKNLEEFATKYRKTINKNPEFRKHFQDMCVNIGVDPLASNKGFWAELLGVGDFYYELGVQIIEVFYFVFLWERNTKQNFSCRGGWFANAKQQRWSNGAA